MGKKLKFQATLTSMRGGIREVFYSNELYIDYKETKKGILLNMKQKQKKDVRSLNEFAFVQVSSNIAN